MLNQVSTEVKVKVYQEVEVFQKSMIEFLHGRGNAPTRNLNEITKIYVDISFKEMLRSGCPASTARRVSKNTIKELIEDMTNPED